MMTTKAQRDKGTQAQSSSKYWDKAWSLVDQCTPVSEACERCWLREVDNRFGRKWDGNVTVRPDRLDIPLRARKPRVYAIWSDLFHEAVSFEFINKAYKVMCEASQHTYLILTKRPDRMKAWVLMYLRRTGQPKIWSHICLGVTAENQKRADERIPVLLSIPAAKRFVSIEPMLGPVDLTKISYDKILNVDGDNLTCNVQINALTGDFDDGWDTGNDNKLNWIILGGESGRHARPMHPAWARSVRDQCQAAGVPFFFKQWGEWGLSCNGIRPGENCIDAGGYLMRKMGTKKSGRLLDGQEHNERPWE